MDEMKNPKVRVLNVSVRNGDYGTYKSVKVELPNKEIGYISGSGTCIANVESGKTMKIVGVTFFKKADKSYWSGKKDKRDWAFKSPGDADDEPDEDFDPPNGFEQQKPEFVPTWKDDRTRREVILGDSESGKSISSYYDRCPACNGEVIIIVLDEKAEEPCPHCGGWGIFGMGNTRKADPREDGGKSASTSKKGKKAKARKPKPHDAAGFKVEVGNFVQIPDSVLRARTKSVAKSVVTVGGVGKVMDIDESRQSVYIRFPFENPDLATMGLLGKDEVKAEKKQLVIAIEDLEKCASIDKMKALNIVMKWDQLKHGDLVEMVSAVDGQKGYVVVTSTAGRTQAKFAVKPGVSSGSSVALFWFKYPKAAYNAYQRGDHEERVFDNVADRVEVRRIGNVDDLRIRLSGLGCN